ncbi:MAG: MFS transporter [Chloroflexi bacterium]|nr:MFS transporter [Chloroflexota bacterium]
MTTGKIYYGWWLVGAAVVYQFTFLSVGQVVVGVLMGPVIDEMGWRVWQFTLGASMGAAGGALAGVIAGRVLDRHGPRPLLMLGAVVCSFSLWGLAVQSSLWVFWAISIVNGLLGWTFFGPAVVSSTLNKWFVRKRGWALAIGSSGVSLAGLITPLAMTAVIGWVGWRGGYGAMAVFVAVVILPLALVMRRRPEDHGLLPDGVRPVANRSITTGGTSNYDSDEPSMTAGQAVRTLPFWQLIIGFGLSQAALMAVLIHAFPFVTEAGFDRSVAAAGLSVNGLGNLVSKLAWGWGLGRFDPRVLVIAAFGCSAAGVSLILVAGNLGIGPLLMVGFFSYGFGFGGTIPLSEFTWAWYFGRNHIGAIRGIGNPPTLVFGALAPVLVGVWFDIKGDYQVAFGALIFSFCIAAVVIGLSSPPVSRTTEHRLR